jgi:hypothetical protein
MTKSNSHEGCSAQGALAFVHCADPFPLDALQIPLEGNLGVSSQMPHNRDQETGLVARGDIK